MVCSLFPFQFHKGTIRTLVFHLVKPLSTLFQFHKGTIRTDATPLPIQKSRNFNSIKVRFERAEARRAKANGATFQFHKGTIRTCLERVVHHRTGNFNSIKVRLEQVLPVYFKEVIPFQFHKGTIRTCVTAKALHLHCMISIP